MEERQLFDLSETLNRLQEENRLLRSALETTDNGRTMLRQGEEFSRLLTVSKRIVSELDLVKVLDLVAINAREIVNADLVMLPMLNEGRDRYTYAAASGLDADEVRGASFGANVGMCGWVLQHERSLLFGETSTHWMEEKTPWEAGQQSAVLVPLFGRQGIIGGLSAIGKQGGGCFTQHDLDLLTMFANQVSIAIENALLFHQRLIFEQGLKEVNQCFLSFGVDPLENIKAITHTTGKVLSATAALYNRKEGDLLLTLAGWQVPPDMPLVDKGSGHLCFDVIARGGEEPMIVRNLQKTSYAETDPNVRKYGLELYIGYPVKSADQQVASLCAVFQSDTAITSYQLSLLHVLGKAASVEEERMLAEASLRSSELRFRSIIENASVGILVADVATSHFRYANPVICQMLGYRHAELLALDIRSLHPASELPRIEKSFAAGEGIQTICKRSDGTLFPVDIKAFSMELDGFPCLVGFFTDMTERHLLDEERLKTQKLEAIGKLAGGIAHDFNNLLQGVFGYLSIAKVRADNREKCIAALEQAEKALQISVRLTNQLLTFSKGGKPIRRQAPLPPTMENSARFALSGSRSEYRMTVDSDLWQASIDEGQIGQVIQNIVLNAGQAMPDGGTVQIVANNIHIPEDNALPGMKKGVYVRIAISDSGMGIPQQIIGRIFDPYFTTKESGSGLGLATSYSIVKNHDGAIDVKSEEGKGTTFFIYLPALVAGHEQETFRPATRDRKAGARVLLMDDELVIREVAMEMLTSLGHSVEFAVRGEEAVEKYQAARAARKPFDTVILDLTVRGGMGGMDTLQKLIEIDPDVKAVASSGYSDDASIANCFEKGFKAVLKKPYDVQELQQTLDSMEVKH